MIKNLLFVLIIGSSFTAIASPANYPEGFSEFYELQRKEITLRNLDGTTSVIPLRVAFNEISLTDRQDDRQALDRVLRNNNLNDDARNEVVAALGKGINSFAQCYELDIADCIVLPERFDFVFDYDKDFLILYVNPLLLNEFAYKGDGQYRNPEDKNASLINHFNISASKSSNIDSGYTVSDEVILGLPYGYVHADAQYRSRSSDLDLYKLGYHLDYKDTHIKAVSSTAFESVNSTDFLQQNNSLVGNRETSLTIGSSRNLSLDKEKNRKYVDYFAPTSGRIVVTTADGERILLNRNTEPGQQKLDYSELPSGKYDIRVRIYSLATDYSDDNVLYESFHTVFNASSDYLHIDEYDYALSAGYLDSPGSSVSDMEIGEGVMFGRGLISYKLFEPTLVGFGVTASDLGSVAHMGASTYLSDAKLDIALNKATTGEWYANTTLAYKNVSFSYEKLEGDYDDNLALALYGSGAFEHAYANYSQALTHDLYMNLSGSYHKWERTDFTDSESLAVSAGVSSNLTPNINANLNVGYQEDLSANRSDNEQVTVSLSVSVQLDNQNDKYYRSYASGNKNSGITQFRNTVSSNNALNTENTSTSLAVGNSYTRVADYNNSVSDISASNNFRYDSVSGGAYASYDTEDNYAISGNLSSSQVVSNGGVHFTSERANSYGLVSFESNSSKLNESNKPKGQLTVKTDDRRFTQRTLSGKTALIPIGEYQTHQLDLNSEMMSLHNTGERYKEGFAFPGSVIDLKAKVGITKHIVAGFIDVFNQPIVDIQCHGPGCIDVVSLGEGVYNLSLMDELPYALRESDVECNLNIIDDKKINYGNNICFPRMKIGQKKKLADDNGEEKIIHFLGAFHQDSDVSEFLTELDSSNINIYKNRSKDMLAVYISYEDVRLVNQRQVRAIESLLLYASNNNSMDVGRLK